MLVIRSEPAEADWLDHRVRNLVEGLVDAFAQLRERLQLPEQALEVVFATDVGFAVRSFAGRVVGLESLEDSVERLSGIVAGKTMFRDAPHRDAVIVVDAMLAQSDSPLARLAEVRVLSHELGHALIGQLRAAGGPPMAPAYLPWEVSRWLARYAIEELVAEGIANSVMSAVVRITLEDGTDRPASKSDLGEAAASFIDSAKGGLSAMTSVIHEYRIGRIALEPMWRSVQQTTSSVLIALAHAQAERDACASDGARHAATVGLDGPLHDMWRSILDRVGPLRLDDAVEFVRLEQDLLDRAGEAIIRFWRRLGLAFRPLDDGFHISVAAPEFAWPFTRSA